MGVGVGVVVMMIMVTMMIMMMMMISSKAVLQTNNGCSMFNGNRRLHAATQPL
jgi:hypothetical protein